MRFRDSFFWLSNFYPMRIYWMGSMWGSTENAYQASKSINPCIQDEIRYMSPGQAKRFARLLRVKDSMRSDWEDVKFAIMKGILREKFSTEHSDLREKLIATKGILLIEENNWHDNLWGRCICPRCATIESKNMLGKLLMEVRDELTCE